VTRPAATLLVLRALGLGDALTGVPALRGLRRAFPGHRLVLAAPAAVGELLQRFGVIDEVLVTGGLEPLRWSGPAPGRHVAVNLHGSGPRSHRLLLETGPRRLIAFRNDEAGHRDGPAWAADEHEVDRWCRLVRSAGAACHREDLRLRPAGRGAGSGSRYAVVHPGAASASRRWPAGRWAEVVAHVAGTGLIPLVTGGRAETQLCREVAAGSPAAQDLGGRLSLGRLADLVAGADLVVCGDTGVAHLATAFATASVLLFGPTSPQCWGPAVDPHLHPVIWPARPGERGDPHADVLDPVLARISVAAVTEQIDRLLRFRAGPGAPSRQTREPLSGSSAAGAAPRARPPGHRSTAPARSS
jgi:ADP-heptose:LPS heptosyltransferase